MQIVTCLLSLCLWDISSICSSRLFQNRVMFYQKKPKLYFFITRCYFIAHNCNNAKVRCLSLRLLAIPLLRMVRGVSGVTKYACWYSYSCFKAVSYFPWWQVEPMKLILPLKIVTLLLPLSPWPRGQPGATLSQVNRWPGCLYSLDKFSSFLQGYSCLMHPKSGAFYRATGEHVLVKLWLSDFSIKYL